MDDNNNNNEDSSNIRDDDLLQNNPDDTNDMQEMTDNQKLSGDPATPFSPPNGVQDRIGDTHQETDTGMDKHEHYDAGLEAAAGVDMPQQAADEDQSQLPPAA